MQRFLMRASIPVDAGNDLIRDPDFGAKMQSVLAELRPENAYFCIENGQRTIYLVVTTEESSELPRLAEPLWLWLACDVEFIPAMGQEDFARAATHIKAAVEKYG
jgi:hypothetical protein